MLELVTGLVESSLRAAEQLVLYFELPRVFIEVVDFSFLLV